MYSHNKIKAITEKTQTIKPTMDFRSLFRDNITNFTTEMSSMEEMDEQSKFISSY